MKLFIANKYFSINKSIKCSLVKLINHKSLYLGIFKLKDILKISKNLNLDVVEISTNYNTFISVCKLIKLGKFQFIENKKYNKKKKLFLKKKKNDKEMNFSLSIRSKDYLIKINRIIKFLSKNINVKITISTRGREKTKNRLINFLIVKIKNNLSDFNFIESYSKYKNTLNYLYFYKD